MDAKTLLVIGAHHDDCEYGAAGLALKAVARGYRVVMVTLAGDHASWKPTSTRLLAVRQGLLDIARDMGVEKRFYDWAYHSVLYDEKGLRALTELVEELDPAIALAQWPYDYWPDHEAAGRLSRHALWFPSRAFGGRGGRDSRPRVFFYEAGAGQSDPAVPFRPDTYVDITAEMDRVNRIIRRLDEVASGRAYDAPTSHELDKQARARLRGSECAVAYAEAFLAMRKAVQDIL
jgi:LmbE family N-acetylglucosaminyl deacetylase